MAVLRKAIDFANYTPIPTQDQVRCLLDQGYTTAIIGVSFGAVARAQLEACSRGGMDIEAFCWVRFNDAWRSPLDKALSTIRGLPVKRMWLDCEDATTWPQSMIESRILEAEAYVHNGRPDVTTEAIYTGGWWWNAHMPTSTRFKDWDLWTANYVRDPNVAPYGQPPLYGGWESAAIWQYAGTVQTCGLNTDRNVILEEHMPTIEYEELKRDDEDIKTAVKVLHERQEAAIRFLIDTTINLAGAVYGDPNHPEVLGLKERVEALEKDT